MVKFIMTYFMDDPKVPRDIVYMVERKQLLKGLE